MKRFCVRVTRERQETTTYEETAYVTVAAETQEEALEKVEERYEDESYDWDWDSVSTDTDDESDEPSFSINTDEEEARGDSNMTREDAEQLGESEGVQKV